jgi:ribosome maturation protein SDO1
LQVGEKERTAQLERLHNEVVGIVAGKLVDPETKIVYTTGMIEKALAELSSKHEEKKEEKKTVAPGSSTGAKATEDDSELSPIESPTSPKGKSKDFSAHPATHPTWTGVTTTRSAKSQALDAMRALIYHQTIPVARARMRLRITCPTGILKQHVKHSAEHPEAKGTVKDRILSFVEEVVTQQMAGEEWEVVGFVEPGAFKGLGEFVGGETRGKGRVEVLETAVIGVGDE